MAVKRMKKRLKISMDRIGELPVDILYFILSLLTVKEAVRTSILSRRWRFLWKTTLASSPKLELDVVNRRCKDFPDNKIGYCLAGPFYSCVPIGPRRRLGFKRHDFVGFVVHVLYLDHFSVKDSSRTRFYLENDFLHFTDQWMMEMAISQMKDFAHHIDQWIEMAMDQRNQYPRIGLPHFVIQREIYRDGNLYVQFPSLFSSQEIGSSVKCWSLKGCSFRSLYSKGYSSLVDLRLKKVLIVGDTIVSILSSCPNLEYLCLSECETLCSLKISGPSLKLKQLIILFCLNLKKININAKNLIRFLYCGKWVKFEPINVPQLSNVIIRTVLENSCHALSYARGKLSSDVPHLESLMLTLSPIEEKKIPKQFSLFSNLKKLVLLVRPRGGTLWGFVSLLQASPYLRRLELHMYEEGCEAVNKGFMERPLEVPHLHLEEIILSGFSGNSHYKEFASFMLNSATNLRTLTILSSIIWYDVDLGTMDTESEKELKELAAKANEDKKTEKDAWEQFGIRVRPGVKLILA